MDIAALSMDSAQSGLFDKVQTALLAKALRGAETDGSTLLSLIASAAPLAQDSGTRIDLQA
ncbi:MAG: YjfB family protein [Spirochaetota bacterium]